MQHNDTLERIAAEVKVCTRCRLAETRTHAVPGHGDPHAPLLLVGEAPGRTEDETGMPFQGMSGRFLDAELALLNISRDSVFISSANKCRPPDNRNPRRDEVAACASYLDRQMALIRPRVVLAMGGTAAARMHPERTGPAVKVGDLRGQVFCAGTRAGADRDISPRGGDAVSRPAPTVSRRPASGGDPGWAARRVGSGR